MTQHTLGEIRGVAVRIGMRLDQIDESVTHSNSEPCCEDHGAVSL